MNNKAHLRPKDYDSNGDIIPMACKEEKGYQDRALAIIDRLTDSNAINIRERGTLRRAILLPERPHEDIQKSCKTCDYYVNKYGYGQCYGQKNAPRVEENEVCESWKKGGAE